MDHNTLIESINIAIKDAAQKEVELAVEDAKKRLEKRIPEIVSGLAINLQKYKTGKFCDNNQKYLRDLE